MKLIGRWDGGEIHLQQDGRKLYILDLRRGGKRYRLSTRCHSETAAHDHLRRFEADPWKYVQEMKAGRTDEYEPLLMTEEMTEKFTRWQLAREHPAPVTKKHARQTGKLLDDWIEDLAGRDLRRLKLRDDIKPALERRKKMRAHRIAAIKAFYGWLRKEETLLITAEDPTLDLPMPQAVPEKRIRRKALPFETVQRVIHLLGPSYRDALLVFAATGMHFTELERLISDPRSEIEDARRGETVGVLRFLHKNRDWERVPVVDEEVLAAAKRLRAKGRLSYETPPGSEAYWKDGRAPKPNQAIAWACEVVGVPVFTLGQMRASVGTWLAELGMTRGQISELFRHKDERTSARFYIDVQVPTLPVAPPRLKLVKG
jgi:hypothetical protein